MTDLLSVELLLCLAIAGLAVLIVGVCISNVRDNRTRRRALEGLSGVVAGLSGTTGRAIALAEQLLAERDALAIWIGWTAEDLPFAALEALLADAGLRDEYASELVRTKTQALADEFDPPG